MSSLVCNIVFVAFSKSATISVWVSVRLNASYVMVCRSGCGICTHDLYSEYMYKGGDRERADCIIVPLNHELPATIDTISNAL